MAEHTRIDLVGVIGAGVIGRGVAQNLAQCGIGVLLIDLPGPALAAAREEIRNDLRLSRMLNKGQQGEGLEAVLGRIRDATDYAELAQVDFVIENVTEKWEIKQAVYREISRYCRSHCVIAANTSCISITRIAAATDRPDRVVGIHFMNPVPLKDTVEMIRGHHTSPETIEVAKSLLSRIHKRCVLVEDMPGFVSNRVLMMMVNEAICLVQDQVASAESIDTIFRSCFGHKMGPLETADLIGLDTILYSIQVLYEGYNDCKYRPCPLLKKMVDAGLLGRKSGRGFYTYEEE